MRYPRNMQAIVPLLAILASATAAQETAPSRFAAPGHDRPNILVLFADDLTFRAIGAAGLTEVKTPHIDRLARRGVRFTNTYMQGGLSGASASPAGPCSTPAAISGRAARTATARDDNTLYPLWGQVLGDAGYQTFAIGKWHNGKKSLDADFQTTDPVILGGMLESTPQGGPAYNRPAPGNPWTPDDPKWKGHWLNVDGKVEHSSVRWADAAIHDMETAAHEKRPFFIYVAFHAPHDPRQAPREYLDMYPPETLAVPRTFLPRHPFDLGEFRTRDEVLAPYPRTEAIIRTHLQEYYAIISHLDAQIGRILEALERSGKADNTLILFAADNGLAVGQHGLLGKQCLYEHSIRVPMIIAGPGVPAGKQVDALVYLSSLFATTCEMARVPAPATVQLPSLVPLIIGQRDKLYDDLYAGYIQRQRMVRDERYKLIVTPSAGMVQLFDIRDDPWETHNLAGDPHHADVVARLRERLKKWMRTVSDPMPVAKIDQTIEEFR